MNLESQPLRKSSGALPATQRLQRAAVNESPVSDTPSIVNDVLSSPGQPLDPGARALLEPRFGHDFSQVRVHTGAQAAQSARAVNALAYTVGRNVVFGAGQYAPGTPAGQRLLAHELTHVVQQGSNPTSDVRSMAKTATTSNGPFEREASRVAEQILQPAASIPAIGSISRSPLAIHRQAIADAPALQPAQAIASAPQAPWPDGNALRAEAKQDALAIKSILQDNTWLGPRNQAEIMAIVEKWANKPVQTGSRLTSFDYFIVGLRSVTFEVGVLVKQYTGVFDQLFHRLSDERVAQFKTWMQTRGGIFKNEQAIEEVKFEVSKEDVIEAAQLSAEVTAAFATGGGSVLVQIVLWLATTLPGLYQKAKTIIDFVNAIRSISLDDVRKLVSAKGLGDLLVKALFGEAQGLPQLKEAEGDKEGEKEPASGTEEKGLIRVLHVLIRIFNALKKVYGKVAEVVNKGLAFINITNKPWFETFSMVYAAVIKAIQAVTNPGAVLGEAVGKIRETATNFFKGIRTKVEDTAGDIKSRVELIGKPAQLLHILADKGVEMVLNFIITHPPSALVKLAFKAIEAGAKKSIIELVREHIPFADKLIKKIAESDTIKNLLKPLESPIAKVTSAIENVSGRAVGLINDVESRALGLLGSGVDLVKQLTGISPEAPKAAEGAQAAQPAAEQKAPEEAEAAPAGQSSLGEFLEVVKQGIHTRLLAIGEQNLIAKGKEMGKAALEKGKQAVKGLAAQVKGLLLGPKVDFDARGQHHELTVEEQNEKISIFVASDKEEIEKKIKIYKQALADIDDEDVKKDAGKLIGDLEGLSNQVEVSGKKKTAQALEQDKHKMAEIIRQLEEAIPRTEFKAPSGATIKVTREWSLLVCDGKCKEIDSYISHKNKVQGTGLDVHHLMEKRFLDPLNKLRKQRGITKQPTMDTDEINSVVLPGSAKSIEKLVKSDPAAKSLEKSPFFHRWLSKGEPTFSISAQLQGSLFGIGNKYSDGVTKGIVTAGEVFEVHEDVYRTLGKPSWIEAIRTYFQGLL